MRSPTHSLAGGSVWHFLRQLDPSARLRLLLLILVLCVLACVLGIYSVPDIISSGRTYLAAVQPSLVT